MSGGVYFWRDYKATLSGSTAKRVRCVGCSHVFEYVLQRTAAGGGHSPFHLNNAGAAERARKRARANLDRALGEGIDPVPCPACGIYQPDMVPILRRKLGRNYEPNAYAKLRVGFSPQETWSAASEGNTIKSYTNFMRVWPTFSQHAEKKIRDLKYPPHVRKLFSLLAWAAWAGVLLLILYVITAER